MTSNGVASCAVSFAVFPSSNTVPPALVTTNSV